jgi:protein disulfide-isomerase A6
MATHFVGATKFEPLTKFFDSILDSTEDSETASEGSESSDRPDDEL